MALFGIRKSFRPSAAELPLALQELLGEVKEEKAELEVVLKRVRGAAKSMSKVDKQLVDVARRQEEFGEALASAESRADSVSELSDEVARARDYAAELEQGQGEAGEGLAQIREEMGSFEGEITGIKAALKEARKVRADVEGLAGPAGTVDQLKQKSEEVGERLKDVREGLHEVEEAQETLRKGQAVEQGELEELRSLSQRLGREVEEASARLARMEAATSRVTKVGEVASRVEQQLQNLNALAEHVSRKIGSLEEQREVVDRAVAQAERLDDLVWDVDKKLKKVTEDSKVIQKTQKRILGIQELVQRVEEQLGTLRTREKNVAREGRGLEKRLGEIRDEIDAGLQRFEMERSGLDTVNTQVLSLRSTLGEFEGRRSDMEKATRDMAGATARADELTARLATLMTDIGRGGRAGGARTRHAFRFGAGRGVRCAGARAGSEPRGLATVPGQDGSRHRRAEQGARRGQRYAGTAQGSPRRGGAESRRTSGHPLLADPNADPTR